MTIVYKRIIFVYGFLIGKGKNEKKTKKRKESKTYLEFLPK
jgi:hypothetical protein